MIKKNNFSWLLNNVEQTHSVLQENVVKAVNFNLTLRNWLIGCYIVEYEQHGEDRAKYGAKLLEELAKGVKKKEIKGLDLRTLRTCRSFYCLYPQIRQTVSAELGKIDFEHKIKGLPKSLQIQPTVSVELKHGKRIRGTLSPELGKLANKSDIPSLNEKNPFRQSMTAELQNGKNQENSIWGSVTPKLEEDYPISSYLLLSRLTFSHFIELIRVQDNLHRLFYEVETIKNNWSVRELARAIDTSLALRTTLSSNKEGIIRKMKNLKPMTIAEIMRDPLMLNFLGLQEKSQFSESDLETAILNHLQKFLIELGGGFCFEARQKRISFDNEHYRIDLVFYHRILKCHVLIDLKIGKFDHADAGQMNMYLNYYKENEMSEGDNPPVGLILCGDKHETLAKYATTSIDNQMFVSQYLLNLPDKKLLESFISKELSDN